MISSELPTSYATAKTSICSQRSTDLKMIQPGCEHLKCFYLEMSFGMFAFQSVQLFERRIRTSKQDDHVDQSPGTKFENKSSAKNGWTCLLGVCVGLSRHSVCKTTTLQHALPLHGWTKTRLLRAVTLFLNRHSSLCQNNLLNHGHCGHCFGHIHYFVTT